jgi:glycerol-3-phosphate dehydrogenase
MASPFSPETREANLDALAAGDFDLLVIGGGITGAGVARDAALRGLRTALVERTDFGAGTSSRSSKLIHGGVRYLQQGEIGLVREAAAERDVLGRIAPHLALPRRMVMPTYSRGMHAKLAVGLWTFDKLAGIRADDRSETWARDETLTREPLLEGKRLHGAVVFTEYLTDDARLVLDTVRGAHEAGAVVANHVEATEMSRGPATSTVTVRDLLRGSSRRVVARAVVNAGGPWVDEVRRRAGALAGARMHLTKGVHLVVRHERLPLQHIVVMVARDKRSVFAVPRGACTYIGTTDTDYGTPADHPEVTAADVAYLLDATNRAFSGPPLSSEDVIASWAGLRPLLHEEGKSPSEISRKDEIMEDQKSGLISIAGGKLTTHRRMAERVVDLVAKRLGGRHEPCRTHEVPLPNGEFSAQELLVLQNTVKERIPRLGIAGAQRLVRLYGAGTVRILDRTAAEPSSAEPLAGQPDVLRAEITHSLDEEMPLTLEDLLERRTRLLLFDARQGLAGAEETASIAASRLGWDPARVSAELDAYQRLAASLKRFA